MSLFFNLINLFLMILKFRVIITNEDNLNRTEHAVNSESDAILYLKRYGYLQNFDNNSITSEQFDNALIGFQKFFRIPISGIFDEITKDAMKRPRCGLPDIMQSNKFTKSKRVKRFVLNGRKWKLKELTWKWLDIPDRNQLNETQAFQSFLSNDLIDLFKKITNVWQQVCDLRFKYSPNDASVNIGVNFTKIDGTGNKMVEVKWLSDSKALISFGYEDWSVENLMSVGVHSIGHVLGLKHSQLNESVMSPVACLRPFESLTHDDIVAVQTLYRVNPNKPDEQYFRLNPNRADWSNDVPDLCSDSKIDSITELSNGVILVFKGNHYFELEAIGIKRNSPRKIDWDYSGVVGPIDAVMASNNDVFIFKGQNYWKFNNKTAVRVNRPITEEFRGLPAQTSVDAAFKSYKNGKTYLFSGQQFWEYDTENNRLTEGNPKKISSQWTGIPDSIDAALSSAKRMQTYFFKHHVFYRFDDNSGTIAAPVNPQYPRRIDIEILRCRNMIEAKRQPIIPTSKLMTTPATTKRSVVGESNAVRNLTIILAILLVVFNLATITVVWLLRQQNIRKRTESEERESGDEPIPDEQLEMSELTSKPQSSQTRPQTDTPPSSSSSASSKSAKSKRTTTSEEDVADVVKIDIRKKAPIATKEESESD